MDQTKTFALLGFLPDVEIQIKSLIQKQLKGIKIYWVSATDENLEGIIINSSFLSSPQIKKYITKTNANVVCCFRNTEGEKQSIENKIIGIDIHNYDSQSLSNWVNHLCGFNLEKKSTSSQQFFSKKNSPSENENGYLNLLNKLKSNHNFFVIKSEELTTWVDKSKNIVYINFKRNQVPGIDSVSWEAVDKLTPPNLVNKVPFDLWLFVSIWHSDIDFSDDVSATDLYKLQRWPRPLSAKRRSEALRLSAFIQSQPASVEQLIQKSGYDNELVCRFIFAALIAGQIQIIETINKAKPKQQAEKSKDTVKLGLVGRLRKKLGFG